MAKTTTTTTTKGVFYTDKNGKRHLLTKEEFFQLMERFRRKANANRLIHAVEEMEVEE